MRRALILLLLLAVMVALALLQAETPAPGDPLTLAAIGFVLLAAFTVSELGASLSLPQVTGYIVAGVALGPGVSNVLSETVVGEMRMFNTLALGLIALGAGLELDAKGIAKLARTLGATIGAKVVLGVLLVAGTLYGYERIAAPLGLVGTAQILAVALVLATLSIGTSPAIALAVMKESGAKGRLMDLILGAAVLKDLVVVVALAIAVAVAKTLLAPDAALDAEVLVAVGKELAGSVAAGALLGGLLIAYIRFVRAEMLLFVAGVILLVAEGARALHLELLLVFIAAGFVVRTFSEFEHDLMEAISMVALPVFIVFFTIAGASIDIATTWTLLPLAGALCAARAVAYVLSSRIGAAVGNEDPLIGKVAWLGYLPQAGVTLGLVGVAADALPSVAAPIRTTGMAVVAVNLLVGPITMRKALRAAGEIGAGEQPAPVDDASNAAAASLPGRIPPLAPSLRAQLTALSRDTTMIFQAHVAEWLAPRIQETSRVAAEALAADDLMTSLRDYASAADRNDLALRSTKVAELFASVRTRLRDLSELEEVPLERRDVAIGASDGLPQRWHKRWLGLRKRFGEVMRPVPVRRICRRSFEPRAATHCERLMSSSVRFDAAVLEELGRVARDQLTAEEATENIRERARALLETLTQDGQSTMTHAALEAAELLHVVGGPTLRASTIRPSDVARDIERAATSWTSHATWWDRLVVARGELDLAVTAATTRLTAERAFNEHVLSAVEEATGSGREILAELTERLATLQQQIHRGERLEDAKAVLEELLVDGAEQRGERVFAQFRSQLSFHKLAVALRGVVNTLPDDWKRIDASTPLSGADDPSRVVVRAYEPRDDAQHRLELWLPTIDDELAEITGTLASLPVRCRDAVTLTLEATSARIEGDGEHTSDEMQRSLEQLRETANELPQLVGALRTQKDTELPRVLGAEAASAGASVGAAGTISLVSRLGRAATSQWRGLRDRAAGVGRRVLRSADASRRTWRSAADIRLAVDAWQEPKDVPKAYARLFRQAPLRDHRWFGSRDAELERILEAESRWLEGGPSSMLLKGDRGSGRTTLLNLAELQLATPRVVQPTRTRWLTKASRIQSLSYELGCKNTIKAVRRELARERTVVIIDDLEGWFTVDDGGIQGLAQLLALIVETRAEVFWLVSVNDAAANLFEEVLTISQSFGSTLGLPPLSGAALARLIERRHQTSSRGLFFPSTIMGRLLGRFTGAGDRDIFFGLLARVCEGRVGHALALWPLLIRVSSPDGDVHADLAKLVEASAGIRIEIAAEARAILERLIRFGPVDRDALREELALSVSDFARHVQLLSDAGFLDVDGSGRVHAHPESMFMAMRALRNLGGAS